MQRPLAVTIFAVLAFFMAFSFFFTAVMFYLGNANLDEFTSQLPQIADMKEMFLHATIFFALLFGITFLAAGIGLLLMKNWARALTRVLGVVGLLAALVNMIQTFQTRDAAGFFFSAAIGGIYYWAFHYLGLKPIRAAFVTPPPAGSSTSPPDSPGPDSAG